MLPETDSIQTLARFWDTHDLSDFEDELEEIDEPAFERDTTRTNWEESDAVRATEAAEVDVEPEDQEGGQGIEGDADDGPHFNCWSKRN